MGIGSLYYPRITTLPDSWKRSSFVTLGALWIASSDFLNPSDYKIRKIRDTGSITTSLIAGNVNLFDRQINTSVKTHKVLAKVVLGIMRAVSLTGVFVFAAPVGSLWHLGSCIYHIVPWDKASRQLHILEHVIALTVDIGWTIAAYGTILTWKIGLKKIDKIIEPLLASGLVMRPVFTVAILGIILQVSAILLVGLDPGILGFFFGPKARLTLKEKFGLVGENGWLLTGDEKTDGPVVKESETANHVILSGYFCDLAEEQAINTLVEFRQIIELLKLELTREEVQSFSADPKQFLPYLDNFLNRSHGQALCDKTLLDQSIEQAKKKFDNYDLMKAILLDFLPPNIKLASFPFSPGVCQAYFADQCSGNQTTEQLLSDFTSRLTRLKGSGMSVGGPSDDFIAIKQKILGATDAYGVLGLKEGAPKDVCKKAYLRSSVRIHPDKNRGNWEAQAASLFQVIDAAYKYINSL